MKIFTDYGKDHTLIKRMLPFWEKAGVEIVGWDKADVHLSFVFFTRSTKIPKVLRIDGVYYDNLDLQTEIKNKPIKNSIFMANGIIYQSSFSKRICDARVAPCPVFHTIIYNGADSNWFPFEQHEEFNIVMCANWRMWKRPKEMLELFYEFHNTYPSSKLHILGALPREVHIQPHPSIRIYGTVSYNQMKTIYKTMDVGLHLAKRDACPNSLIEIIAAGIPVVVSDKGGGATEIANETSGCLIAMDDNDDNEVDLVPQYTSEWNKLSSDFKDNVLSKLQRIFHDRPRVKLPIAFSAEYVAKEYLSFMKEALK